MLKMSNGFEFDFCCGSGAVAFDGRGWPWEWPLRWMGLLDPTQLVVVAKTVTVLPRPGNLRWWKPWTCVWFAANGFVNAVGLTNKGLDWWIRQPYRMAHRMGYKLAASVWPMSAEDSEIFVTKLNPLSLRYVELNLSCPNTTDHLAAAQELLSPFARLGHPLVLKVSHAQAMDPAFLKMLHSVEAVHAINTIPWAVIFGEKPSPVRKGTGVDGGVSGPPIKSYALEAVRHIKQILPTMPVIGGGGIENVEDVDEFRLAGADAFSIASCFLKKPWHPRSIISAYRAANS